MGNEEHGVEFEVISYFVVHDERLTCPGWLVKGKNGTARIRLTSERTVLARAYDIVDDLLKQAERDELNGRLFISDAHVTSSETGNS